MTGGRGPGSDLPDLPFERQDPLGRRIEFRACGPADRGSVEAFYASFDPADRAQGIPPARPEALGPWLDVVLEGAGVVAVHGDRVVGHAALVRDGSGGHELVVFVLQGYRGTGTGTALVRALLGLALSLGVGRIWLTVQRWNHPAIAVYRKTGFVRVGDEGLEIVMARPAPHADPASGWAGAGSGP